ncbi:MAG TPA: NUDIX domain-containing protein [Telluria sp.]|nr:NUDIX domain-containing protein [Telluria sp.]
MAGDTVRIVRKDTLSDNYYPLRNVTYEQRRGDGKWQTETREVYESASGAAALLYNRAKGTVLLTRQFRIGARLSGHDGFLIEAAAGVLDDADPAERVRAEIREETGYDIAQVEKVLELFASPGTLTERVHYFLAEYDPSQKAGDGGGKEEEGEDIDVVEMAFGEALAKVQSGEICDAKTVILLQFLQLSGRMV